MVTRELESARSDLKTSKSSLDAINKEWEEKCGKLETTVADLEKRKLECEHFLGTVDEKYQKLCSQAEAEAEKIKVR